MVSLVTMSTTEAAIAVRRWELQRRVTQGACEFTGENTFRPETPRLYEHGWWLLGPRFLASCRQKARDCSESSICSAQNDGRCEFVPRLPRKTNVDVRLCHACHAKCRKTMVDVSLCKTMVDVSLCYVCDRWYVTKLCVKFVYVKDGM